MSTAWPKPVRLKPCAIFRDFFSFLAISKNLRILKEIKLIVLKNVQRNQKSGNVERPGLCRPDSGGGVELPDRNGLVPMKKSGMALMKCAELQKQFGCGSLRQYRAVTTTKPENVPFFWPWLRRGRECPERANEKEVRELRLALSPLKSVEKSRKNPRAYRCPACRGRKAFGAHQCRRCWRLSVRPF